ncbi:TPA: helix-turn-helix domain-containing protein [Pseudomonas putida]|nr:helix-turn-helix domain-containing protein [Pseudomonas putida]HEN8715245.1 helix-turn-helix domain-containing protein [Pseudomonas putida]
MGDLVQLRTAAELGAVVRKVRKQQSIIQTDLASMLGKSHVLLRDIETGKGTVALASVLQVLNELGIRIYADLPE